MSEQKKTYSDGVHRVDVVVKKQTIATLKLAIASLNERVLELKTENSGLMVALDDARKDLDEARADRKGLYDILEYVREDREALIKTVRILSETYDISTGRCGTQPTWKPTLGTSASAWAPSAETLAKMTRIRARSAK